MQLAARVRASAPRAAAAARVPRVVANAVDSTAAGPASPAVSVGIDLGTTNSVVAVVTPEAGPFCLPVQGESTLMPSVVAFTDAQGGVLVGRPARAQASANPENTFYSVKRFLGQEHSAVAKVRDSLMPPGAHAPQRRRLRSPGPRTGAQGAGVRDGGRRERRRGVALPLARGR